MSPTRFCKDKIFLSFFEGEIWLIREFLVLKYFHGIAFHGIADSSSWAQDVLGELMVVGLGLNN